MVSQRVLRSGVLLTLTATLAAFCQSLTARAQASGGDSIKPFAGRWDLTINSPKGELPSWIEVSKEQGRLKVVMVGVSDHATPLKQAEIKGGEIDFLSPQGEEGFPENMQFQGKLEAGELRGTVSSQGGKPSAWTGRRAPSLKRTTQPTWGKPIQLFDGKDLDGWKFSDPSRKGVWKVENGELVKDGSGSEIISDGRYEDFELHLEFNCGQTANSGVYLRGRYEVQIETDSASEPPSHHTGGVYGFLAPHPELPRKPGAWRTFDITLVGRTITVVMDGQTIINQKEVPGITGGALDSHEGLPGPIYLQGGEKGRVAFRNIVLTPAQ